MTVADSFDAASRSIEENRRALLAAVAAGGTAGRQAYEQARNEVGQLRGSAIQAALADAGRRGAPQGMLDQISSQVGQGYDRQLSGMAASQGSRDATFAQQGASGNTYMNEAQAAIPGLRAKAQRQREALQAEAMEKAQERAMKLELAQMQMQKAMQDDDNPLELARYQLQLNEHNAAMEDRGRAIQEPRMKAQRDAVTNKVTGIGTKQPKILTEFKFAVENNPDDVEGALAHVRNLREEARTGRRRVFKKDGSYGVLEGLLREFYKQG